MAGFVASLVDGALGMGFGPTSSTILLGAGLSRPRFDHGQPGQGRHRAGCRRSRTGGSRTSTTASCCAWPCPGMVGAVVGVTILANVDGDDMRPLLAALAAARRVRILVRFSQPLRDPRSTPTTATGRRRSTSAASTVAAAAGGVTNGLVGAWGPVVTPFLLHRGLPPRYAIGSVNTAEVAVAIVAAGSLLASLGGDVASSRHRDRHARRRRRRRTSRRLDHPVESPPACSVSPSATLLLLTNVRELAGQVDIWTARRIGYAVIAAAVVFAVLRPRLAAGPLDSGVNTPAVELVRPQRLVRPDASLSENRLNDLNDLIVEPAVGGDHSDVAVEPDTLGEVE